jgi:hypothetical protein
MNWFKNHLNLSLFFAWLVANFLFFMGIILAPEGGELAVGWVILFVLGGILILGTEVWYLLQKRRSLFYLFLNLLNWIGFIILLALANKGVENTVEFKVWRLGEPAKLVHTDYDLRHFQEVLSCPTCAFYNREAAEQGQPWCDAPTPPDIEKNYCHTYTHIEGR